MAFGVAFSAVAAAQTTSGTAAAARKPAAASAAVVTTAELARKLEALEKQNAELQAKVEKLEAAQAAQAAQTAQARAAPPVPAVTTQTAAPPPQTPTEQAQPTRQAQADTAQDNESRAGGWAASTTVGAYGEIGYSHPTKSPSDSYVDVARAVIGIEHQFDDRTKFVGEWEWEHAITSSDDAGESEVEQLWVEREFVNGLRGRAGLFLMPVGLINQNHEPTAYYGVFRPDVDTKIVPSTWREVGLGINGDIASGLNYDFAVTTGPNLSRWDPESTEGRDRGPLQSIHGEGQFAAARQGGVVGALNWRGVPGVLLGGSVVYDAIGQHQPDFLGNGAKLLMLDVHGRYQFAGWDFAGEYIRGTISHTDALNASYAAGEIAGPTFVPRRFFGGYGQVAYTLVRAADYRLAPFARYEILNTAASFRGVPDGLDANQPNEHIWTLGASLYVGEGVVLKADYRGYRRNKDPDIDEHFNLGNSFNLGVGFSF